MAYPKRIIIRQARSANGCNRIQKACIRGLGLKRIRHTVNLGDTSSVRGMINKVPHLVEIQDSFIDHSLILKKRGALLSLKFSVKENAIDSFNEALKKYEQGQNGDLKSFKFVITHLAHCIELVLKMYLQTLDGSLVFTKCYRYVCKRARHDGVNLLGAYTSLENEGFDFESLLVGQSVPHTVTVDEALAIAKCEVCKITGNVFVDQDFIDDIAWMKNLRNAIEHFEFEFTPKEVRLYIGRLVRGLSEFTDIFSLFELEKEVGKDRFHVFEVLADEYRHALTEASLDVAEAKHNLFAGVRLKHHAFVEWNIYTCPCCGNNTMIPNDDSSTGYRCTLAGCENEESEDIEVDCDICSCPWPNGDMTSWGDTYDYVCPRCDNPEGW